MVKTLISCRWRTSATRCITANIRWCKQRWTLSVMNLRPN